MTLHPCDLPPRELYERLRPILRPQMIDRKARRRVVLGPNLTVLFENVDTVLFQVLETLRVEPTPSQARIQRELESYDALIPGEGVVTATLFVDSGSASFAQATGRCLRAGRLSLSLNGNPYAARCVDEPICPCGETCGCAVRYLRFDVGQQLSQGSLVSLRAEIGNVTYCSALSRCTLEELSLDQQIQGRASTDFRSLVEATPS